MFVVVVRTRLTAQDGRPRLEERQDLIYREAVAPSGPAAWWCTGRS
ncbi:hypothetical protein ACIBIZ_09645 [Nonomuraea spiralis]